MTTAFYNTTTWKIESRLTVTAGCPNCGKPQQRVQDTGPSPLDMDTPVTLRMTCPSCRIHWYATSPS